MTDEERAAHFRRLESLIEDLRNALHTTDRLHGSQLAKLVDLAETAPVVRCRYEPAPPKFPGT